MTYRTSPHLNKVEDAEGRNVRMQEREGDNIDIRKAQFTLADPQQATLEKGYTSRSKVCQRG